MKKPFETDSQLLSAIEQVNQNPEIDQVCKKWAQRLSDYLIETHSELSAKLLNEDFLKTLLEDTTISSTGNGSVIIAPAAANEEFRLWFHDKVSAPLSVDYAEAHSYLTTFHRETKERFKVLCGRTPHLKINRVFCALYPQHFTTIADEGALTFLHKAMGGSAKDEIVSMHAQVKGRIDKVLGQIPEGGFSVAYCMRLALPWFLYEKARRDLAQETDLDSSPTDNALKPWPAALRRKGLTAIKGGFNALLELLPDLQDGVSRTEFEDLITSRNPSLSKVSIGANINTVSREFDLCTRQGDTYSLTPRGFNLLQKQDPDELCDHLLTRIFGVDHVLLWISKESITKGDIVVRLQGIHPGWTSTFAPTSLVNWMLSLGLMESSPGGKITLSARGHSWSDRITWTPESLTAQGETLENPKPVSIELALPHKAEILSRMKVLAEGKMVFPGRLVDQLHAGLWSHPIRHFAVLTGISGSGKTQLALNYARALCNDAQDDHGRVQVIPVQPGWYDPSHLLGYVNPLQEASYRSTPFLELLQRAADEPEQSFVAILDEMNLSHPEHYLAPVLSAMETHGWIDLHQLDASQAQVPQRLRYPANLAIIGTVNMDETTHGLSDKVLDRAYTLEFWEIDVEAFAGWTNQLLPEATRDKAKALLIDLNMVLSPVKLHFGWRTISDVIQYLAFTKDYEKDTTEALDDVTYAKILPKLRGESSTRFDGALNRTIEVLKKHGLNRSADKAMSMMEDLKESGSARFWR